MEKFNRYVVKQRFTCDTRTLIHLAPFAWCGRLNNSLIDRVQLFPFIDKECFI